MKLEEVKKMLSESISGFTGSTRRPVEGQEGVETLSGLENAAVGAPVKPEPYFHGLDPAVPGKDFTSGINLILPRLTFNVPPGMEKAMKALEEDMRRHED